MTLSMELKEQKREGREEGRKEERLASIRNLMKKLHMTATEAMNVLEVPLHEQAKYASQL